MTLLNGIHAKVFNLGNLEAKYSKIGLSHSGITFGGLSVRKIDYWAAIRVFKEQLRCCWSNWGRAHTSALLRLWTLWHLFNWTYVMAVTIWLWWSESLFWENWGQLPPVCLALFPAKLGLTP